MVKNYCKIRIGRMLIAQAKAENMSFLTHDPLIPYYEEKSILFV